MSRQARPLGPGRCSVCSFPEQAESDLRISNFTCRTALSFSGGWIRLFNVPRRTKCRPHSLAFLWRLATVSELIGEDRSQLGNPNSKANQFIRQFTQEMVQRYNDSPAIWGWEFGNEANLAVGPCRTARRMLAQRRAASLFGRIGQQPEGPRLTSQQLRTAISVFRRNSEKKLIHPASSSPGLRFHAPTPGTFSKDRVDNPISAAQAFATLLTLTPNPMNMVSVHAHEKAQTTFPGAREARRTCCGFRPGRRQRRVKPLFLGEVSDPRSSADGRIPSGDRGESRALVCILLGV